MVDTGDRDIVLAAMAVQLGFARRETLADVIQLWSRDRTRPLSDVAVEQRVMSARQRKLLEPLVEEHLALHGNDSTASIEQLGGPNVLELFETQAVDQAVEETLDSERVAETLDPAAPDETAAPPASPPGQVTGFRAGQLAGARYAIEQLHATGGLGAVYRADDKEFGRTVAVKEMQSQHQHDPTLRARFMLEATINARLQHPAIVPVFSLGSFPDGRPFYAMRFVEGESLDDSIRRFHKNSAKQSAGQRSLELRQLLGHFVDLCNAIAYAHSKGVLHRDLKPANVMLGKFGETLLVDWGLAKSIGDHATARDSQAPVTPNDDPEFTQVGAIVGTPAFMSPEQARGDAFHMGPASDIYGLGATLFALLTGRHATDATDVSQLLQRVSEGKIDSPLEANPSVPRPLSAICQKAMALDPQARYASAGDLAADIERWLADEPTEAYAEPLRDRIGRAVRHHRSLVVGLGVLMLTTIIAMGIFNGVSRHQNRLLRKARDEATENLGIAKAENARAEQNLADLRQTAFELQDTAEGVLARTAGTQGERKKMTALLVEVCERMHQQRPEDPGLKRDLAQAYRIYGNLLRLFNNRDEALELHNKSITLLEQLVKSDPYNRLNRDRLSETLRSRSNVHKAIDDIQNTVDDLSRAGQIAEELLADDPDDLRYLRTTAVTRQSLADQQLKLGMNVEATASIAFAVEALSKLVKSDKSIASDQPLLLLALNEQGEILRDAVRLQDSETVLRDALAQAAEAIAGGTNDTQHSLARISLNLGRTLTLTPDRHEEANAKIEQAITIWTELIEAYPSIAFYQRYQAAALTAQAELMLESGNTEGATANLDRARQRLEPTVKLAPKMVAYRDVLVDVLVAQAHAELATDQEAAAEELLREAVDHMRQITEQTPQNVLLELKHKKLLEELNSLAQ